VVGFCFSYAVEGSIRDEAGETLLPVRHNPSTKCEHTHMRRRKGVKGV
jgi:hypothetical protein